MEIWFIVGGIVAVLLVLAFFRRRFFSFGRKVQLERARELFKLQRERLEAIFLKAAAASGKPRGLLWKECLWEDGVKFVRDRATGEIAALAGVNIRFEAIEGSDMEGLPAVNNLRSASAVFFFQRGHWNTVGKVIFNMNPDEAAAHFQHQYEKI